MNQKIGREFASERLEKISFPKSERSTSIKIENMINSNLLTKAHLLMDNYDELSINHRTVSQKIAFERLKETPIPKTDEFISEAIRNMIEYDYLIDAYILMSEYDDQSAKTEESETLTIKIKKSVNSSFGIFISNDILCSKLHPEMDQNIKIEHLYGKEDIIKYILDVESRDYNDTRYLPEVIENSNCTLLSRSITLTWLFALADEEIAFPAAIYSQQYLDRFMCTSNKICRKNYQLYATSAYSLAFKYLDDMIYEEEDFVYNKRYGSRMEYLASITDYAFTPEEISNAEIEILGVLEYNMVTVTVDEILDFMLRNTKIKEKIKPLKKVLSILCVISELSIKYKPSVLAHSIIHVITKYEKGFDKDVEYFYDFDQYSDCVKYLKKLFIKICSSKISGYDVFYEYYNSEVKDINSTYKLF